MWGARREYCLECGIRCTEAVRQGLDRGIKARRMATKQTLSADMSTPPGRDPVRRSTCVSAVPVLTVVAHPQLQRVGDRLLLESFFTDGRPVAVSRNAPDFVRSGGLLALRSNIGQYTEKDDFAVIPEVGINFGFQLTERWRLLAGYNFLYWGEIARPGQQVNPIVNPTLVPTSQLFGPPFGPIQPSPFFNTTDFWAQGVTFGLAFNY